MPPSKRPAEPRRKVKPIVDPFNWIECALICLDSRGKAADTGGVFADLQRPQKEQGCRSVRGHDGRSESVRQKRKRNYHGG